MSHLIKCTICFVLGEGDRRLGAGGRHNVGGGMEGSPPTKKMRWAKRRKGAHTPKRNKKGSHFINKWRCLEVSQFPGKYLFWGSFSKMNFRRRPFNQKPLVFRKNPKTHLEVQGSFGDEGTFQECQNSWILKIPLFGDTENYRRGFYFDAEYVSAHFCRAKITQIAIWGKICLSGRKSSFSVFSPRGPL